jgi:hypothetical protein
MRKRRNPRKPSLVKVKAGCAEYDDYIRVLGTDGSPGSSAPIIFLGELKNDLGHCVLSVDGKIYDGLHTDNLVELEEDEL